jgi:hypothetical protein
MTGALRVCTLTALAATLAGVDALPARAQSGTPAQPPAAAVPAVPPVESLFADAVAKETAVRKALAARDTLPTVLRAVRTVVSQYENVVRHYPASGYCDDALWRAGQLAREAFEEFHEARERSTALRLLQLLASEYPSSRFARQVPAQVSWLNAHPASGSSASPVPATAGAKPDQSPGAVGTAPAPQSGRTTTQRAPSVTPAASAAGVPAPARLVAIKAIRRAVLADVVRVVIEMDAEVAFHDERLENPSRIFVDLSSTRANFDLIDKTLRFDADTDIVRQIRIGRHRDNVTRVVLEAAGVSSYSVYPLYSP